MKTIARFGEAGVAMNGELIEFPAELRGGRNLLRNSGNFTSKSGWSGTAVIGEKDGIPVFTGTGEVSISQLQGQNIVPLDPDTDYVYTVEIMFNTNVAISNIVPIHYHWHNDGANQGAHTGVNRITNGTTLANTWTRVSLKTKTKDVLADGAYFRPFIYSVPQGVTYWVKNLKLEKGSTPTPWTPAPEDLGLTYPDSIQSFGFAPDANGILAKGLVENVALPSNVPTRIQNDELQISGEFSEYPDVVTNGLVLWYDFTGLTNSDEQRRIVEDLSGNGNNGTLVNFAFQDPSGYKDGGLQFDGVDDYLSSPLFDYGNGDSWTFEFVLDAKENITFPYTMIGTFGDTRCYFAYRNTGSRELFVSYQSRLAGALGQRTKSFVNKKGVVEGKSHLSLSLDYSSGMMAVHHDGVLVDRFAITGVMESSSTTSLMHLARYSATYFNIKFLSIKKYARALTNEEIAHNYAVEKERWNI